MYSALATYMYMHVYVKLDTESYTTAYTTSKSTLLLTIHIVISQELYSVWNTCTYTLTSTPVIHPNLRGLPLLFQNCHHFFWTPGGPGSSPSGGTASTWQDQYNKHIIHMYMYLVSHSHNLHTMHKDNSPPMVSPCNIKQLVMGRDKAIHAVHQNVHYIVTSLSTHYIMYMVT